MANEFKHDTVGTSLTEAEWVGIGTHVLDSQATGDVIYASSATQLSRLGVGTDGDVLTLASGIPSWAASSSAAADLTGTTLASNVVSSSLTTVGTLTTLTVDNVIINDVYIGHTSDTDLMTLASGGLTVLGTITVGAASAGHDVQFHGAGVSYMLWDASADGLLIRGAGHAYQVWESSYTSISSGTALGILQFTAPDVSAGGDSVLPYGDIRMIAQDTFSATSNAADMVFATGHSETATEKFRITSQGELGIGGENYGTSGQVLTSGGAGVAPSWATASGGGLSWADYVGL